MIAIHHSIKNYMSNLLHTKPIVASSFSFKINSYYSALYKATFTTQAGVIPSKFAGGFSLFHRTLHEAVALLNKFGIGLSTVPLDTTPLLQPIQPHYTVLRFIRTAIRYQILLFGFSLKEDIFG